MIEYRSFVDLDVHARTIVGCVLDDRTGEVQHRRLGYDLAEVVAWVAALPGPQQVTYEAGPTGFGLFRLLRSARIRCVVAAPSKLQRPTGDRVKTDARDALHLARLLRLGEIVAVKVASMEEEAARDLVRAREDTRQDLMGTRHRMSKLLLRHGLVYSDGAARTGKHDVWLRAHRAGDLAFTTAFDASYEAVVQASARNYRPGPTSALQARWDRAPAEARLRGQAGNERLHHQWVRFTARKKRTRRGQHRDRPRTRRLVLVPGSDGRLAR